MNIRKNSNTIRNRIQSRIRDWKVGSGSEKFIPDPKHYRMQHNPFALSPTRLTSGWRQAVISLCTSRRTSLLSSSDPWQLLISCSTSCSSLSLASCSCSSSSCLTYRKYKNICKNKDLWVSFEKFRNWTRIWHLRLRKLRMFSTYKNWYISPNYRN